MNDEKKYIYFIPVSCLPHILLFLLFVYPCLIFSSVLDYLFSPDSGLLCICIFLFLFIHAPLTISSLFFSMSVGFPVVLLLVMFILYKTYTDNNCGSYYGWLDHGHNLKIFCILKWTICTCFDIQYEKIYVETYQC